MEKIIIVSDSFSANELKEALQQEIQEEQAIQLELQKEVSKTLEVFGDPTVLIALGGGVVAIVKGLLSVWEKSIENKKNIKIAEIQKEKDIEVARIQAESEKEKAIEVAKIQVESEKEKAIEVAKIQAAALAMIKIKTGNGEIEIPYNMPKEEQLALLESFKPQTVKSIALITKV